MSLSVLKKVFIFIFAIFVINFSFASSPFQDTKVSLDEKNTTKITQEKEVVDKNPLKLSSPQERAHEAMTNPAYQVTAGDVYSLTFLAGNNPVAYSISVDSTYKIRVANLAVLSVTNTSFISLKKQIEEIVTKNFPMSGVQFNLVSPGSFKVIVKGEVDKVVEQDAWALTRLSQVVDAHKNYFASIRDIEINRDGKVYHYDLFKAQRDGDFSQDPYLRPGDVITLNPFNRLVTIEGAVKRPGTYELLDGENLKELVEIYGNGLTPLADTSRIQITKLLGRDEKSSEEIYLRSVDENYHMDCYDKVLISSYKELKPVVFIEGAIAESESSSTDLTGSHKISIRFDEGLNYATFVRNNQHLFNAKSDLKHAYIIRRDERINIDLEPMLYDKSYYSEFLVQPYDTLLIPFTQLYVSVAGAVAIPGRYPYIPDRTYDYYIGLAGGIIQEKNVGDAVNIVDVNGDKISKNDIIPPEATITAKSNSFTYYFNMYAPIISTLLGIISTSISIGFMATSRN